MGEGSWLPLSCFFCWEVTASSGYCRGRQPNFGHGVCGKYLFLRGHPIYFRAPSNFVESASFYASLAGTTLWQRRPGGEGNQTVS